MGATKSLVVAQNIALLSTVDLHGLENPSRLT